MPDLRFRAVETERLIVRPFIEADAEEARVKLGRPLKVIESKGMP